MTAADRAIAALAAAGFTVQAQAPYRGTREVWAHRGGSMAILTLGRRTGHLLAGSFMLPGDRHEHVTTGALPTLRLVREVAR